MNTNMRRKGKIDSIRRKPLSMKLEDNVVLEWVHFGLGLRVAGKLIIMKKVNIIFSDLTRRDPENRKYDSQVSIYQFCQIPKSAALY